MICKLTLPLPLSYPIKVPPTTPGDHNLNKLELTLPKDPSTQDTNSILCLATQAFWRAITC